MPKDNNPVIGVYHGVSIRRYNRITLKFGEVEFKKVLDEVVSSGLSIHKVLAYSGTPCERCKDTKFHSGEYSIKKGLICLPESNGINIIQHAMKKFIDRVSKGDLGNTMKPELEQNTEVIQSFNVQLDNVNKVDLAKHKGIKSMTFHLYTGEQITKQY